MGRMRARRLPGSSALRRLSTGLGQGPRPLTPAPPRRTIAAALMRTVLLRSLIVTLIVLLGLLIGMALHAGIYA